MDDGDIAISECLDLPLFGSQSPSTQQHKTYISGPSAPHLYLLYDCFKLFSVVSYDVATCTCFVLVFNRSILYTLILCTTVYVDLYIMLHAHDVALYVHAHMSHVIARRARRNRSVYTYKPLYTNAPVNCMPQYPPPGLNHGERGGIDRVRRH